MDEGRCSLFVEEDKGIWVWYKRSKAKCKGQVKLASVDLQLSAAKSLPGSCTVDVLIYRFRVNKVT